MDSGKLHGSGKVVDGAPVGTMGKDGIDVTNACAPVAGVLAHGDDLKGDAFAHGFLGGGVVSVDQPPKGGDEVVLDEESSYKMFIQPLLEKCVNVAALMAAELKLFRPVPEKNWPFPPGYKTRVAPSYWAYIFSVFSKAEDFAEDFLRKHALAECALAGNLCFWMSIIDVLLRDKVRGWINLPLGEQLARSSYSYEVAFRNCWVKPDWCKPPEGTANRKNWVSKVDWRSADRIEPRAARVSGYQNRDLDREIKGEMTHSALMSQAENRLNDTSGPTTDRLNPS